MTRTALSAIAIAAALAAVVSLSGCSARVDLATTANPAGASAVPRPVHTRAGTGPVANGTVGTGNGGAGSLTVAITSPISVSGHANTTVSCSTGRSYKAVAGPASVDGTSVSLTVVAAGYTGPGSYSAVVSASVTPAGTTSDEVAGLPGIPVTITSTGGSIDLAATGTSGKTLKGSFAWACS